VIPDEETDTVVERLRALVASRTLPPRPAQAAEQLFKGLSSPVRIALMGPNGSGKSTLGNVLVGARIIPDDMALPSSEIRFAEKPGLAVIQGDGARRNLASLDYGAALALSPAFIEIHAPQPTLRKISLLEAVTDGSTGQLIAAAKWAARRTDMVIWVTPEFDPRQQALWRSMPDTMKDHAILVLSKTDIISATQQGPAPAGLPAGVTDDFITVFRVAAKQALADVEKQVTGGADDWGCKSLIDDVIRRVEIGRQADVDGARLFLKRYASAAGPPPTPRKRVEINQVDAPVPTPDDRVETAQSPSPPDLTLATALSDFDTTGNPAPDGEVEAALTLIRGNAERLLEEVTQAPGLSADRVLTCCAETFDALEEAVHEDTGMYGLVLQAADFVVLLQLEKSEQAAQDAVIALLQLKRDFEQLLAA